MHGTRVWVVNVHLDRVGFVTPGNDRVPVSRDYFKGTYTKLDFPIAPRIDFLFVSAALGRKNARVIPKSPGDHFPVWADILIPGQGLGVQACFIVVIGGGYLVGVIEVAKRDRRGYYYEMSL
ncbi:hypothetical protein Dpo_12c01290 [Desulfotignum phosphitoxidans DSM 13687]|jgi:hypothetical protein|uniref:Uncharacterized protein n=2 Tax=Desulfotignum phosphitoxidans TaxID=190898 RepID=S0G2A7_9BACT|nr:hypothetical protein Dpo_12c01290 [Desulfotignum phosphitoxidans DSM 13687]